MVGPNYHAPAPPTTSRYTLKSLPQKTSATPAAGNAGEAQSFAYGQLLPEKWWTLFHSPVINQLVARGLEKSPTLAAARATLAEAKNTFAAQRGNLMLPGVNGGLGAVRTKTSGLSFGAPAAEPQVFNVYDASAQVSYLLDIFGGTRRQLEALLADVDYARYELQAAQLTLSGNIVNTSIQMASLTDQIESTRALIRAQQNVLTIVQQQYTLGANAQSDVLLQQTQLAQTQALLPPLQQQLAQTQDALAVLVGELPSDFSPPQLSLQQLTLPKKLPISLPAYLVEQRPDIQASSALLHAASAQIGVALSNMLPQINLTASLGTIATSPGSLFGANSEIWSLAGQLAQPIFHGGALKHQKDAAVDAYQAAFAQYRTTVLNAFQNVADSLRAIENDAGLLQARSHAERSAFESLRLSQKQYRLGGKNYLTLLQAEEAYQQTRLSLIEAKAMRFTDTATLFQALGGGWWHPAPTMQTAAKGRMIK